ncbi:MAG: 30S ribosomal protein S7 [Chloroflexi bacterium]|uniref:Small ribosomal subunit protein uS7 n=1 Tax=Candidatus Chlorohelix allophototropha TaxID=3003348 RepID=A0A8T7M1W2_9CHLR|nr:30S ribosomal protein S7 [Chloroflexota bacterium]WJW65624.1 30S ribosomal protein S7 [Chloroflexota bacterium L227-S17]
MPRRARVTRREILPDPVYKSRTIQKIINKIMYGGKKGLSERIVYTALEIMGTQTGREPMEVFEQAMRNATPRLEVKPKRVGGATLQVPVDVKGERGTSLAIRWILNSARNRSGKSMAEKLAAEFLDASNNTGTTIKKREDTHKMAEANKAFAHYKW